MSRRRVAPAAKTFKRGSQLHLEYPRETYGITHLRAGFFFENLLGQLESIRDKGRIYLPVNLKLAAMKTIVFPTAEK